MFAETHIPRADLRSCNHDNSSGRLPSTIVYDLSSFTIRYIYEVVSVREIYAHCIAEGSILRDLVLS